MPGGPEHQNADPGNEGTPPSNLVAPTPGQSDVAHGVITRAEILVRAQSWIGEQVPYSETEWWHDGNGVYRQDCSGYVSMSWELPQQEDFWTGNLATVSHQISTSQLLPGDILLSLPHTVIFAGWADPQHTTFNLYEEAHPGTNARYVTDAPLSTYLSAGFRPYRYDGVIEGSGALPPNPTNGQPYSSLGDETDPNGVPTAPDLPNGATVHLRTAPRHAGASLASSDDPTRLTIGVVFSIVAAGGLVGSTLIGARSVRRGGTRAR